MNREELGLETGALALDCSLETWCQRRRKCKPLEKEHQCGWESCIPLADLRVRPMISESRSLEMERKVGGKFHLKLNISLKPIANKYHEGKMKRTLKRELKVFEIAERKVKRTSLAIEIDAWSFMCCFSMQKSIAAHTCGTLMCMMLSCWVALVLEVAQLCAVLLRVRVASSNTQYVDKMVLFDPSWNTDQGV